LKIKLLLGVLLINISAWPQAEHGTVVVVYGAGASDGYIVVATDSLGRVGNQYAKSVCKITAISEKLVVAVSGMAGRLGRGGRWDFSLLAGAHEVSAKFTAKDSTLSSFASLFTNAWATEGVNQFNHELRVHPKQTTASSEDDVLASGIVIGLDGNGVLGVSLIKWHYKTLASGRKISYTTIEHRSDWPVFLAGGEAAIVSETYYSMTERGKHWKQELENTAKQLPASQWNTNIARGLVDLTIHNLPLKTVDGRLVPMVGPPIDSITIDRAGHIQWGEQKEECH
jgi:hypothetical protein